MDWTTDYQGFLSTTVQNTSLDVDIVSSVPLPVTGDFTNTGTQLIEIDPNTYPIPVIDQGTAPQEIIVASGAVLNVEGMSEVTMSTQFKDELYTIQYTLLISSFIFLITIAIYWFFFKQGWYFLKRKLW